MPALNADSSREKTDLPFYAWADAEGPTNARARRCCSMPGCRNGRQHGARRNHACRLRTAGARHAAGRQAPVHRFDDRGAAPAEGRRRVRHPEGNALVDDGAMLAAFAALRPGVTELEIEALIIEYLQGARQRGGIHLVSVSVATAPSRTTTAPTGCSSPNDAVLIDIGGRKDGYPSDLTRVATIGKPDPEFDKVHAVLETRRHRRHRRRPARRTGKAVERPPATSSPPPATARTSSTARATGSASTSTSRPTSPPPRSCRWRRATSSPSSPASTSPAASASVSRRS